MLHYTSGLHSNHCEGHVLIWLRWSIYPWQNGLLLHQVPLMNTLTFPIQQQDEMVPADEFHTRNQGHHVNFCHGLLRLLRDRKNRNSGTGATSCYKRRMLDTDHIKLFWEPVTQLLCICLILASVGLQIGKRDKNPIFCIARSILHEVTGYWFKLARGTQIRNGLRRVMRIKPLNPTSQHHKEAKALPQREREREVDLLHYDNTRVPELMTIASPALYSSDPRNNPPLIQSSLIWK